MSFLEKLFGRKNPPPVDGNAPFMEHPTGKFATALEAITSAMKRLQSADHQGKWITFSGQGRGSRPDSDHIEDVPYRDHTFNLRGQSLDIDGIMGFAGLDRSEVEVETDDEGMVTLPGATPEQLARFLDAIFRKHFGIKPHEGENDYAVGAEWPRAAS